MGTSAIFSGNSRFANDFSQIIDRTIAVASLPIVQLGQERGVLTDRENALTEISSRVGTLRAAIDAIHNSTGLGSYSVSASDGSVLSPSVREGALPGSYTIEVVALGSKTITSSIDSLADVQDPSAHSLSSSGSFTLTVGAASYTINPSQNTLNSLAEAINKAAPDSVQAVILNVGTLGAPDYRLSLQSKKLGPQNIQLNDGTMDLLGTSTTGTLASYRINGIPAAPIETDSATQVLISPGLSVDLLKQGTSTIVIKQDSGALNAALSQFSTAYNSLVAELDKHRGQETGALNGEIVIADLGSRLNGLTRYTTSNGNVKSFSGLGFSFSDKGVLSFDSSKAPGSLSSSLEYLGSTGNEGFLSQAESLLDSLEADTTGLISITMESYKRQIASTDLMINNNQERVDLMRESLMNRMATADALIATLEQQASYMSSLIEATRLNVEQLG